MKIHLILNPRENNCTQYFTKYGFKSYLVKYLYIDRPITVTYSLMVHLLRKAREKAKTLSSGLQLNTSLDAVTAAPPGRAPTASAPWAWRD